MGRNYTEASKTWPGFLARRSGREMLNTLENWVTDTFSQIPIIAVRNIRLLNITWALPPEEKNSSVVLLDSFVSILSLNLSGPAHGADIAKMEYQLVAGEHSLVIGENRLNHKIPILVEKRSYLRPAAAEVELIQDSLPTHATDPK